MSSDERVAAQAQPGDAIPEAGGAAADIAAADRTAPEGTGSQEAASEGAASAGATAPSAAAPSPVDDAAIAKVEAHVADAVAKGVKIRSAQGARMPFNVIL
jgi:hypothetical protein